MHLRVTAGGASAEFVSSPIHVAIDESARTAELASYINREITANNRPQTTDTHIDTDFIQPWLYSHASEATIVKDLRVLKRAGYSNIIMQSLASTTGGKPGDPLRIKSVWYETNALGQYKNADTATYDMLGKLLSAANRVGIGVYLGGSDNEQWWNESDLKNQAWADENAAFENALYEDLHNKYANNSAFKGWYWTPELYSNPSNLEQYWSRYLNNVFDVAGNLAEWTNETTVSDETNIRSNGYTGNGIYGNATYVLPSGPYHFPHVGFRVVLYVE